MPGMWQIWTTKEVAAWHSIKKDYKPEDIMFPNQAIITSELVGEMKQSYME